MLVPIRTGVLVRLDPEVRMQGVLHLADMDTIKFCTRCKATSITNDMSAPECIPEEEWVDDSQKKTAKLAYGQRWRREGGDYVMTGINRNHSIDIVRRPAAGENFRIGTVVQCAPRVKNVVPGDRIMIAYTAGNSLEDLRIVKEEAIVGLVEEEAV